MPGILMTWQSTVRGGLLVRKGCGSSGSTVIVVSAIRQATPGPLVRPPSRERPPEIKTVKLTHGFIHGIWSNQVTNPRKSLLVERLRWHFLGPDQGRQFQTS